MIAWLRWVVSQFRRPAPIVLGPPDDGVIPQGALVRAVDSLWRRKGRVPTGEKARIR